IIKAYVKQATSQQLIQKAAGLTTKLIQSQNKESKKFVGFWETNWINIKSQISSLFDNPVGSSDAYKRFNKSFKNAGISNKKEEIAKFKEAIKDAMKDSGEAYKKFLSLLKENNLYKYF